MRANKQIITASMLYDLVACEHRPWMDLYADPATRDDISPFVELLWRRGVAHEEEVISGIGIGVLNLRTFSLEDREAATLTAMARNEPLIYRGRISADDLLGEPDLLRLEDGKYVPGDIKSGAGEEGPSGEDRKPKKHYGVQLALYVDVLEHLGLSAGRRGFIWDVYGLEVPYDLTVARGPKSGSLWDEYQECLIAAREIVSGVRNPGAAYSSECKLCVWYSACLADLEAKDDLTLLPGVGRAKRAPFLQHVSSAQELAALAPERFLDAKGKSLLKGVGPDSVALFHARAVLRTSGGAPYLKGPFDLPTNKLELFFDIETDPTRDHCYLHGFVARTDGDNASEQFIGCFSTAPTPEAEREAFAEAWQYIQSSRPCTVYIYSKYERTWWRALQARYPDVCSKEDIEALFEPSVTVDLLQVVQSATEWPTRDHSIKTLAKYLGFEWRDAHPSGAASIEWYDRYVMGDQSSKARILQYNEDDCRAMRVLLDGIRGLQPGAVR